MCCWPWRPCGCGTEGRVALMEARRGIPDLYLLLIVFSILGIGIVMVGSASSVDALAVYHNPYYFLERQIIWSVLGTAAMLFFSRISYWRWQRNPWPLYIITVVLLAAVLVPHVGREVNGSRRWLGFGPLTVQPSEFAKLSMILVFAATLTTWKVRDFWHGLVPHVLLLAVVGGLVILQPDLGTAAALAGTAAVMLFVAGARMKHLGLLGALSLPTVALLILKTPYRRERFFAFLDPWKHPHSSGYHIIQALYALGSGGLLGDGLGRSRLKYFYLPEQHTDFIFAILGEELGFIGGAAVIVLFVLLAIRGYRIALRAPDNFGAILATGLTTMVVLQAAINIGVVTGSLPITGIPLPFVSYGGSSLVFSLAGVGILLNISKHGLRGGG